MNIAVQQMAGDLVTRGWLSLVFAEPSNIEGLPVSYRNDDAVGDLFGLICSGRVTALLPSVDGVAAGLCLVEPAPAGLCHCHQFIMPRFRGWPAFSCVRECTVTAFALFPWVTHLMGLTPLSNKAAVVCAKKAGFMECGRLLGYYDGEDCVILVKRRSQ